MATFGENLKRIRKSRGLTQTGLGDLMGKRWSTIARYENQTISPNALTIAEMAKLLNCRVGEFFGEVPKRDKIETIVKINGNEVMKWQSTDTE